MSTKLAELQAAAQKNAQDAKVIAEKADTESRSMTEAELAEFNQFMAKAAELLADIKTVKKDISLLDGAKALAAEIGGQAEELLEQQKQAGDPFAKAKNLGLDIVTSAEFKAAMERHGGMGKTPSAKSHFAMDAVNVKSLFVGGNGNSAGAFVVPEQTGIIETLGRAPLTLRQLISVRRTGSDAVEYVRQTAHTNAAAPVAEATSSAAPTASAEGGALIQAAGGGYKPEGSWTYQREVANVTTIAEWVPATKRALADVAQLEGLINDELRADIAEAEEAQIMGGDGEGENLTGILNTPGIQAQAFDTDIFRTVRRAITKVRVVGRSLATAVALSPTDVETVDLARESGATGKFLGAGPFSMGPRTLWGLPIVETETLETGTALVGDFSKAVLWDREETTVSITDSHADFFIRNMVAILAEERVAFGVTRPAAFVEAKVAA